MDINNSYSPEEGTFYPWAHARCIRRSSDNKRTVVTINTESKDRHGTIIDPEGGNLDAYRNNPIFLINHDYNLVAGNGANVRFQNGQWIAEVDDSNWDLEDEQIARWYNKVKKGVVRMASIGFMPLKIERIDEEDEDGNMERKVIIREWEMLEWSFTPIGSNPEALVKQRNLSIEQNTLLKEIQEEVRSIKDGDFKLSDEQMNQIAERIKKGTTSTPEETEEESRQESESAFSDLDYVEPRKPETKLYNGEDAVERLIEKFKRKTGKA